MINIFWWSVFGANVCMAAAFFGINNVDKGMLNACAAIAMFLIRYIAKWRQKR
jgi:hypothetical protein